MSKYQTVEYSYDGDDGYECNEVSARWDINNPDEQEYIAQEIADHFYHHCDGRENMPERSINIGFNGVEFKITTEFEPVFSAEKVDQNAK